VNDFWVLAKKELMSLVRDRRLLFGLIVLPLLLFPTLGHVIGVGIKAARGTTQVVIANFDNGTYSRLLIKSLELAPNISVTVINASTIEEAVKKAILMNKNVLVVVPSDFSKRLSAGMDATVYVYGIFKSLGAGIKESVGEARLREILSVLNKVIAKIKLEQIGVKNPSVLLNPISMVSYSVINGKIVQISPTLVSAAISSQAVSIPLVVFMMVTVTAQMAAGAIASEKENKTLETLLTLPVKRTTIVSAKIFGTATMGLFSTFAYLVGMRYYLGSVVAGSSVSLAELGLKFHLGAILLLSFIVFLTIVFSLALAMIIALFAEDVQTANSLTGVVIVPLSFPTWVLIYTSLDSLPRPLQLLLLAMPFTHPIVDYRRLLMENYLPVFFSVLYLLFLVAVTLSITAKLFSGEIVLTSKFRWFQKK